MSCPDNEAGNVAVLGFDYWQREFSGDKAVVGKILVVQGKALNIIGITPPEFFGMKVGEAADFYLPMMPGKELSSTASSPSLDWVIVIGRLKPGIAAAQALPALQPVLEQIHRESLVPEVEKRQVMGHLVLTSAARGLSALRYRFSLPARILMGVAGLILLIACSNVANLLLAQGSARRREITLRLALGAQRVRLVRQLLTESALLAGAGALAGLLTARWASRLIVASLSDPQTHVVLATPLSGRVLLFSLVSTLFSVLVCGLIPAFSATRVDMGQDLKLNAGTAGHSTRTRLSRLLVVGQVAMSVAALVTGGMLLHSLFNLESIDVGYDREHVLAIDMDGSVPRQTAEAVKGFYDRLLEQTEALPNVRSAALSSFAPVSGRMIGVNLHVEGYSARSGEELKAFLCGVRPGYFNTLGITLLQGRDFDLQDSPDTPQVAIVNLSLARHYFGNEDPIGKRIEFVEGGRTLEIVGVVADAKYYDLREATTDFVYTDSLQGPSRDPRVIRSTLSVRAGGSVNPLRHTLASLIRSLDPSVRISRSATLQERIDDSLHTDQLIAALCGALSLLALSLSGVGLYGVLAYSVAQRTGEMGVRMALGARREHIFRLVVGEGMKMVAIGLLLGSAAAVALTGLLKNLLYGVRRGDPVTFLGICLLLVVAAALACYVPARRATRVDPMVALRNE